MAAAIAIPAIFAWPVIAAEELVAGNYVLPALAFGAMYFLHQNDVNTFLRNYLGVGTAYVIASKNTIGTQIVQEGDAEYAKVKAYNPGKNILASLAKTELLSTQAQFDAWGKSQGF